MLLWKVTNRDIHVHCNLYCKSFVALVYMNYEIGQASDCETHMVKMFITIFSAIFTGFLSSSRHTHMLIKAGC